MTLNTYDIGENVDLIGTFTDPDTGDPVSPPDVAVTIYRPLTRAEVPAPPPAVEGPPGRFVAVFAADQEGRWRWKMESAAAGAVERGQFHVRPDA